MTDENTQPGPENEAVREDSPGGFALPLSVLASALGGGKGVHEAGVHGSVLAQTLAMVENYTKPELGELAGPDGEAVPIVISHNGVKFITPEEVDQFRDAPRFRRGTAILTDLQSFIGHVNRYKDSHTVIFAKDDPHAPALTAVLDYHEEGSDGAPRFGKHRTQFHFPVTPEWRAWTENNGTVMSMTDFAKFIEDRFIDVLPAEIATRDLPAEDPTAKFVVSLGGAGKLGNPGDLMRVASGLQVHESSTVKEATRLQSGEGKLVFTTEHQTTDEAGEAMTVPPAFAIAVPVFKGEAPYCVFARLRYRKNGGRLAFWYELFRADLTFDAAINGAIEKVQGETGLTVWKGAPEA